MNIKQFLLISTSIFLIAGCERRMPTDELCAKYPELRCDQLNMNDGQCRLPRTDLIWHRKAVIEKHTVKNVVKEYHLVSAYQKCLDLAAQIEPTKVGNKKERRFNALMHTYDEQKRILKVLSQQNSPEAFYFMWTQGDHNAIHRFLAFEETNKLNTADLQYSLATYYITRDKEKTVSILHKSLSMAPTDQELLANIIESLASVNHNLKRSKHAYIWVLVGQEMGLPVTSEQKLNVMYRFDEKTQEKLKEAAEKIYKAIKDKKFRSSLLPKLEES